MAPGPFLWPRGMILRFWALKWRKFGFRGAFLLLFTLKFGDELKLFAGKILSILGGMRLFTACGFLRLAAFYGLRRHPFLWALSRFLPDAPNACAKVPSENMIAAHRLFAAENYSCALYKGFERRLEAFFAWMGQRQGGA